MKFVKNLELERKKQLKEIEESYESNFHKFTPLQLFKFLEPLCHADALRLLYFLIIRAQAGSGVVNRAMYKKKYGSFPSMKAIRGLIKASIIEETLSGAYTLTAKVNDYAEILSMMRIGDKAPELVHLSNYDFIHIEKRDMPAYCAVTKQGAVLKYSFDLREIKDYVNEYIEGKVEEGEVIKYIKEEDIQDLIL